MRQHLAKLAFSTALICGGVLAANACPQSTVMKDTGGAGSFQLAQAGGTGGTAGSAGTSGTGAGRVAPQDTPTAGSSGTSATPAAPSGSAQPSAAQPGSGSAVGTTVQPSDPEESQRKGTINQPGGTVTR
jgi:hypothetical protein